MKKDLNIITEQEAKDTIKALWFRRRELKAQMDNLKAEDNAIVQKLNEALELDLQDDSSKNFQIDDLKLKATPKINRNVNADRLKVLLAEDPDAQRFADIFKTKYELLSGKWKKLTRDEQLIFSDCITEKPGKTEYEEA